MELSILKQIAGLIHLVVMDAEHEPMDRDVVDDVVEFIRKELNELNGND